MESFRAEEARVEQPRLQRKIQRGEWRAIVARHAGGESLASIARAYGCTAPAIRYIIRQAQAADRPEDRSTVQEPQQRAVEGETGQGPAAAAAPHAAPVRPAAGNGQPGFDLSLREAMTVEVSAFLVAFDALVAGRTARNFELLRDATDRLLRAAAHIRIELERTKGREIASQPERDRSG
jgi:transposase-like protein